MDHFLTYLIKYPTLKNIYIKVNVVHMWQMPSWVMELVNYGLLRHFFVDDIGKNSPAETIQLFSLIAKVAAIIERKVIYR